MDALINAFFYAGVSGLSLFNIFQYGRGLTTEFRNHGLDRVRVMRLGWLVIFFGLLINSAYWGAQWAAGAAGHPEIALFLNENAHLGRWTGRPLQLLGLLLCAVAPRWDHQ